jgi:zinc transport system substrate-binding protein
MFIYVGGESDKWVDDVLANATNKDMVVINLLEVLGDKALCAEDLEGMEHTHDHGEEGHEGHDGHDHHDHAKDEHVWLSLKNAAFFCNYIADKLQSIDASNKDIYAANTASYVEALTALDEEYQAAVTEASRNTLLFGDRFPFRYLASDYSLHCYAAFSGCSAESEASFETIAFLAKKIDELNLTTVLTIDATDKKVAETIIASTQAKNAAILSLNSLQATTLADAKNGVTYLNIMKENLETLTKALN